MESRSLSPEVSTSTRFKDRYGELIAIKAKAQHFAAEASTAYGPESRVSFRSEELVNAIQRLEWELMRAEK
jgi:hypothetical protein